ncbi:AE-binding protein [Clostridium sp. E02]|nr:AE-binding protein [Clostridium sp. E02]
MRVIMPQEDDSNKKNIPEIDSESYKDGSYVEPLPESERPRKDGPGGE